MRRRILSVILATLVLLFSLTIMASCSIYDFVFNSILNKYPYSYATRHMDYGYSSIDIYEFNNNKYISTLYNRQCMNFKMNSKPSVIVGLTCNPYGLLSRIIVCQEDEEMLLLYEGRGTSNSYYGTLHAYSVNLYHDQFNEQLLTIQDKEVNIKITLNELINNSGDPIKIKDGEMQGLGISRLECAIEIKGSRDFISVAEFSSYDGCLFYKGDKIYLSKLNTNTFAYELFEINQEYMYLFEEYIS